MVCTGGPRWAPSPFCWRFQGSPAHLQRFSKRPPGKKHHGPAVSASGFPPSRCTPQGGAGGIGSYLLDGCMFTSSLKIITSSSVIHKTKFQCPGTEEGPASSGHFSFTPCAPAVLKCPRSGHPLMSWSLELSGLQLEASFTQSDRHLPLSAHQHAQLHTRDMASGYPGPTPPRPRAPLLQADGGTSAAEHLPLAKCVH